MGKGSNAATPLTCDQFLFVLDEFHDQNDFRMEVLSHLMFRCIRISDCLTTLKISDIYHTDGKLKDSFGFFEKKAKRQNKEGVRKANPAKLRFIEIAGARFRTALDLYWQSTLKNKSYEGALFYSIRLKLPLKDSGVRRILDSFVNRRHIKQCSPHSFRKGGARHMYQNGTPIEVICSILQHSSVRMTFIYIDIIPPDELKGMMPLAI